MTLRPDTGLLGGVSDTELRGFSSCLGVRDFVLHFGLLVLMMCLCWGSEFPDP